MVHQTIFAATKAARPTDLLGVAPPDAGFGDVVTPGSDAGTQPDPALTELVTERLSHVDRMARGRFSDTVPRGGRRSGAGGAEARIGVSG
ncbi:hypothetical protein [Palleronia rufa]|uniref:hypothetical protein n=1 Tax=Palleronia rufa TaxID=1530186 RepID=UPI0005689B00|nr:hypothetical protein [Palleronia rufa]